MRLLRRRQALLELRVLGFDYQVFARPETSDRASFEHVFSGAYDVELPGEPELILDLGSNAGYASVYFALRYPSARVLAVEPVPANAAVLRRNVADLDRVEVVEGAAWPRAARLTLVDPGKGYWGMRVAEDASGEIAAVTIAELLDRAGTDTIDLLKVDIEGAERELFSENTGWLAGVRMLVLELHDRFVPGCRAALDEAVLRSGVRFYERQRGEDVLLSTTQF
jgi:FkbM family methyltransferase